MASLVVKTDYNPKSFLCILLFSPWLPRWLSGKNSPAMQEMLVQSLGWEDSLKKEMATHSSILAWEILWTEVPGGLQSTGLEKGSYTT